MTDLISKATGKLGDPLMFEWAIRQYERLPAKAAEIRRQMLSAWFHELFLAKLIEQDDPEHLPMVFRTLPPEHFANLTHLIVKKWPVWPGRIAGMAASVLAINAPEEAFELYDAYLQRVDKGAGFELERFAELKTLLTGGTTGRRNPLLDLLSRFALRLPDTDFEKGFLLSSLLPVADGLDDETLESVLIGALRCETRQHAQQSLLKQVFQGLFGHAEFMDLVFAHAQQHSQQKMEPLTACFDSESLLAQWDEWLDQTPHSNVVLPALALASEHSKASATLYRLLSSPAVSEVLTDPLMAQIAVAGCIHAHALATVAISELDVSSAVALLAADLDRPRWAAELQTHLTSFAKSELAPLMIERLPGITRTYGGVEMAAAMGSLGWAEFVPGLIDAMADDQSDFMCEAAQKALIEIDEPAQKELITRWNQLDQTQRIYGLSIISDIGGTLAADFAAAHFDDLLDGEVESCCELLLAAPDERLLERLRPELRRRQVLIDRAYAILADLLDCDDEDAQQARERTLDYDKRSRQLRSAFDAGNFARDSLSLQLKCPSCGSVNGYDVAGVITTSERHSDIPDMVDDELPCASCGAIVEFEFTADAKMALTGELIRMMASRDSGEERPSLIRLLDCQIGGKVMPIAAGIQQLRQCISAHPKDVRTWFQLGNLLSHINRPQGTLAVYQQALLLAPNAVDVSLQLAQHLTKIGHEPEAIKVLLAALDRKQSWTYVGGIQNVSQTCVALYNQLRRSLGRNDLPALHPASLPAPKQVGRNDPCPCGSGKKFKKCCG